MSRYAEKEDYLHNWPMEKRRGHLYRILLAEAAAKGYLRGHVLHLGCNSGSTTQMLKDYPEVERVAGVEGNRKAAESAWEKNLAVCCAWFPPLPDAIPFAPFHTVLALDVIEHIYPEDMPAFMSQVRKVVIPKGHVILYSPTSSSNCNDDPAHVQEFASLDDFVDPWVSTTGYQVIEARHETRENPNQVLCPGKHDAYWVVLRVG